MFLGRLQTITSCSIFYICFIDICNFCKWRSIFWSWYIPPGVGIPTRSACLEEYEKKKSSTRHSFIQSHVKVNINIKTVCFRFPWGNLNKIRWENFPFKGSDYSIKECHQRFKKPFSEKWKGKWGFIYIEKHFR